MLVSRAVEKGMRDALVEYLGKQNLTMKIRANS